MTSQDLQRSKTWAGMAEAIDRDFKAGMPFETIHMMNVAIAQRTLRPYAEHRARLDALLWHDDPAPKTIIELGGGYGAMASFWPEGSRVFDVDLPEMLQVAQDYLRRPPGPVAAGGGPTLAPGVTIELVPFTEADRLPFDGAYFFSTFALTETTPATWAYYIAQAPRLAGLYAVGWRGWADIPNQLWPWDQLRAAFKTVRRFEPYLQYDGQPTDSVELAAVNR